MNSTRNRKPGIRELLTGIAFLCAGLYFEYNFIHAFLYGGQFPVIKTILSPFMIAIGTLLLIDPVRYISIIEIDGNDNEGAFMKVVSFSAIGLIINGAIYAYATWLR